MQKKAISTADSSMQSFIAFMGLPQKDGKREWSHLDAHEALLEGLPSSTLQHLIEKSHLLKSEEAFEKATGMSIRTFHRRMSEADKSLNSAQSGRIWTFVSILLRATALLGSQKAAEAWLVKPAMALNQQRPLDLLASPVGLKLVEDLLGRLEYGVYT